MAKPETTRPIDSAPETAPGGNATNLEPEAPNGRFFDAAAKAGQLSLAEAEPAGPHQPLKEGARPLTPWGLSIFEGNPYYGNERLYNISYNPYTRSQTKSSLKPNSVAILEILATSDTGRLTFLELRDKLGTKDNEALHDAFKEITGVFEWYHLPYFTNVVDFEAEERYITLHKTPPEDTEKPK